VVTDRGTGAAAAHPGPESVTLHATVIQAMIDHARGEAPNEACGVIIGDRPAAEGGHALRWVATRNKAASPFRYEIDPDDLYRLTVETDDAEQTFWAVVHSHTHTEARPSSTDVAQAFYPDALYILVSLAGAPEEPGAAAGVPTVRAWRIVGGEIHEVELLVDAGTDGDSDGDAEAA
jgi:[CysO sulfur-carrier protein]-S-L-cysteine hydrolase